MWLNWKLERTPKKIQHSSRAEGREAELAWRHGCAKAKLHELAVAFWGPHGVSHGGGGVKSQWQCGSETCAPVLGEPLDKYVTKCNYSALDFSS